MVDALQLVEQLLCARFGGPGLFREKYQPDVILDRFDMVVQLESDKRVVETPVPVILRLRDLFACWPMDDRGPVTSRAFHVAIPPVNIGHSGGYL
jgi:hypothetical protein